MAKQDPKIKAYTDHITPAYAAEILAEQDGHGRLKSMAYAVQCDLDPMNKRYSESHAFNRSLDAAVTSKLRRVLDKLDADDSSPVEQRGWGKRRYYRIATPAELAERAQRDAEAKERDAFVARANEILGTSFDEPGHSTTVELNFETFKELITSAIVHKRLH